MKRNRISEEEKKLLRERVKKRYDHHVKRAKLYGQDPIPFSDLFDLVLESYKNGFKCFYCGRKMRIKGDRYDCGDVFSIDHYIPLSEGIT